MPEYLKIRPLLYVQVQTILFDTAHDELKSHHCVGRTCKAGLVCPKQAVLSILVWSVNASKLTITHCNITETWPRAAWGVATLDLTKSKLPRQSIIRHPESTT